MLLRSEEFQTEDGVRMIREFYGERGSEGEEIITATHERPADAELVVDNIAKETTLTAVKNAVGTSDDTEVESTLFGKLAQLKQAMPEDMGELLTKINSIDTNVKNTSTSAGYIKAADGRRYAPVMEGVTMPLATVRKGNTPFQNSYNGATHDSQYLYVTTANGYIYKVELETLEIVNSATSKDAVFGCDENYLYVGTYQMLKKLDKNTFEQQAASAFDSKYSGGYDCNVLIGSYVFNTNSAGIIYTKFDKNSFSVVASTTMGDGGKGRISGNSKYIVCSPANVYRAPISNLDDSIMFSKSLSYSAINSIICDENYVYVLGSSKFQKYDIETMQLVNEVSAPVSISDGMNFDCQNDDFLFLVPSGGGKMKKVSKTTLEVITESEENVSKVFFADSQYVYCVAIDGLPTKIAVTSESSMSNIVGFKEV